MALSGALPYYVSFLCAVIGGGIFAMLHALLCIRFRANQVISGVVMNILAVAMTTFLTKRINASIFGHAGNKFLLETAADHIRKMMPTSNSRRNRLWTRSVFHGSSGRPARGWCRMDYRI